MSEWVSKSVNEWVLNEWVRVSEEWISEWVSKSVNQEQTLTERWISFCNAKTSAMKWVEITINCGNFSQGIVVF